MEPYKPSGWNVAEIGGGLVLSADGFTMQLDSIGVDKFIAVLNSKDVGEVKDSHGSVVTVELGDNEVILTRAGDETFPHGIVLPIDAFTEVDDEFQPILEGVKPAFRRVGNRIKRAYRVVTGIRKGRIVQNPATANKPRAKASTRNKLRIAAKKKKFIRALKSKLTRQKPTSLRLRRMNEAVESIDPILVEAKDDAVKWHLIPKDKHQKLEDSIDAKLSKFEGYSIKTLNFPNNKECSVLMICVYYPTEGILSFKLLEKTVESCLLKLENFSFKKHREDHQIERTVDKEGEIIEHPFLLLRYHVTNEKPFTQTE